MIAEFKNHKIAYVVLTVVLFVFVLLFLHFWPDRSKQRLVTIGMSSFYFIWGVVTHTKSSHINKKVVLEYFAVAVLASSILILLTF